MDRGGMRGGGGVHGVKNRTPAAIQITAEHIIIESRERAEQQQPPAPRRHVTDPEELAEHRLRVRKEYEDHLRRDRKSLGTWLRYAKWEDGQQEIARARSVYERALDVDYRHAPTWIRYAEMEMRAKFVNRARNVWDRAISLLPRVDSLWYRYTYMEEVLGNVAGARILFERWMSWEPAEQAWLSYAQLELRAGEVDRARAVYARYVACHPSQVAFLRIAKWEERNGQHALARRVLERAVDELRDGEKTEALYLAFARFEEACGEFERARVILRFGLECLPKAAAEELYRALLSFEKQHGSREALEGAIIAKRRHAYEEAVSANALNYDAWFDFVKLEEAEAAVAAAAAAVSIPPAPALERVREVYERAVAAVPPIAEKRYWRRYIYLWLGYAVFEELVARDAPRARTVFRAALQVTPHKAFTFAKLWLLAASAEIRAKDVSGARKLLGAALGLCPKPKIISGYIDLELSLGELDRVRRLHEKHITLAPTSVLAWTSYAELERSVGEEERARALYELAVTQSALDMPEAAWKAYLDFEIGAGQLNGARALYQRLLSRTQHVKVWLSAAAFESTVAGDVAAARAIYSAGFASLKSANSGVATIGPAAAGIDDSDAVEARAQRALLLEAWRTFEQAQVDTELAAGGDGSLSQPHLRAILSKLPHAVKKRRPLYANGTRAPPLDNSEATAVGWEEYADFVFPDDEAKPAHLRLLEAAARWKASQGALQAGAAFAAVTSDASAGAEATGGGSAVAPAAAGGDSNEIDFESVGWGGGGGGCMMQDTLPTAVADGVRLKRPRNAEDSEVEKGECAASTLSS